MRQQARRKYNYKPIKGVEVELSKASFSQKRQKRLFAGIADEVLGYDSTFHYVKRYRRSAWRRRLILTCALVTTLGGSWYWNQSRASYGPAEERMQIFKVLDVGALMDRLTESDLELADAQHDTTQLAVSLPAQADSLSLGLETAEEISRAIPLLDFSFDFSHSTLDTEPLLDNAPPDDAFAAAIPAKAGWLSVTIKSGDNLSGIFEQYGLSSSDLHQILNLGDSVKALRWLQPGDQLHIQRAQDGTVETVVKKIDIARELHVKKASENNAGFVSELLEHELEERHAHASGVIENSLFTDGRKAGLPDQMILQLVKVFGWDIDFALDIQAGDRFSVVYEEFFHNGEKVQTGEILAAEFINNSLSYQAVRYTDPNGITAYYTPQGEVMQKAFLRTPVKIGSVSSGFGKRHHPLLNKIRAHRGVDYRAPVGTPVYAAANGKVTLKGWKTGYGKTVQIQHGDKYSTLYGHLSNYGSSLDVGDKVKQGDIIGYVGQTGLASGPHLHYEFHVEGVHKDPLSVKLPKAMPIEAEYQKDFFKKTRALIAQLNRLNTLVAQSTHTQPKEAMR